MGPLCKNPVSMTPVDASIAKLMSTSASEKPRFFCMRSACLFIAWVSAKMDDVRQQDVHRGIALYLPVFQKSAPERFSFVEREIGDRHVPF